jgi:hypothetical protein
MKSGNATVRVSDLSAGGRNALGSRLTFEASFVCFVECPTPTHDEETCEARLDIEKMSGRVETQRERSTER